MRYTRTHEWVEVEDEEIVTVGVSDRAQQGLGEVVFVELPEDGEEFEQDALLGSIESIDGEMVNIYSPVTGEVVEINIALENSPDLINKSPEGDGWLFKMRMEVPAEFNALMTIEQYEEYEEEILEQENEFDDEEEEEYF